MLTARQKSSARRMARLNPLIRRMHAYYQRGFTLAQVGAKFGDRDATSISQLFLTRGLPTRRKLGPEVFKRIAATRRAKLDPLIAQMHADYMQPMSLSAVGRKYNRTRESVRLLFVHRGLAVRVVQKPARKLANGQIAAYVPFTAEQLDAMIARATSFRVPTELKFEWRQWSLARRGEFIARLRAHLNRPGEMPTTPFSANAEPFDYASAHAHAIAKTMNTGRDSRKKAVQLHICSQGVIWREQLWFWSPKTGYERGPWTPEHGRPMLHHVIFKEAHGPVPAHHGVRMRDGNPNNLDPANLVLAHRGDVARETRAKHLTKKSRALTGLLLDRAQNKNNSHANLHQLQTLRQRA